MVEARERKAAFLREAVRELQLSDAIVLNRIDELTPAQIDEVSRLVKQRFPGTPLVTMSAKTGQGFEALTALLDQQGAFGRKILDIDYDVYAEGEAELGWLNSSIRVAGPRPFALDELLLDVVSRLQEALARPLAAAP